MALNLVPRDHLVLVSESFYKDTHSHTYIHAQTCMHSFYIITYMLLFLTFIKGHFKDKGFFFLDWNISQCCKWAKLQFSAKISVLIITFNAIQQLVYELIVLIASVFSLQDQQLLCCWHWSNIVLSFSE